MARLNTLKRMLAEGKTVFGTWCELPSPTAVNVIATTGLDFIIIDQEHGPMGFETAELMSRAAEAEGCWPIPRVTEGSEATILRALELGTQAILVPHVESAREALRIARACRYHPEGARGLGPYTRNHNYTQDGLAKTLPETNRETWVGILVEGKEGLRDIGKIAAVPGIDMVYLGVYDISQSVGLPGQLRHPTVLKALEKSVRALRKAGVAAGSYAPDLDYARILIESGCQFIAYSVDIAALRGHYVEALKALGPMLKR